MKIALVGNPNAGKSSIFNHLTGLRQKTGNFPGVTVDKRIGRTHLPIGQKADIIDLPGAYSLYPNSSDERIVTEILCERGNASFPDLVIYIADACNLERQLLLCSQIIDLEIPIVMALTMTDIAEETGIHCNPQELCELLRLPVVKVNGRTGKGLDDLLKIVSQHQHKPQQFYKTRELAPTMIEKVNEILNSQRQSNTLEEKDSHDVNDYNALLIAHHYKAFDFIGAAKKNKIENAVQQLDFNSIQLQVQETLGRFDKIVSLLKNVTPQKKSHETNSFTERIDKLLTHHVFGSLIFLAILFFLFQAIFSWAAYPMGWIDALFTSMGSYVKNLIPEGILNNLLVEGIIPGLTGIFIFIPQIAILFVFIVFLEDVGYMSRAIFLSDNIMRKFGLSGRSMVSLFSGLACAVPAIMSARTITNRKERLITIMVTPLVSCAARIPVFTILIAVAIPAEAHLGIFNLQGIVMMSLYLLGIITALGAAFVMKKLIKTSEPSHLIMELPTYKTPHWKNILLTVWEKVKIFVTQAGKIIMIISIILWFLSSYGPSDKMEAAKILSPTENSALTDDQKTNLVASRKMEVSYAGHLGRFIEPVIIPLGFDWKIGIALITSFAAREVFVGTIATLYSIGSSGDEKTILSKLQNEINPKTGKLTFTLPVTFSLLIFYVFAMQCMSTVAVVKRETKSWRWPLIQILYMTTLAYLGSLITYQLMS